MGALGNALGAADYQLRAQTTGTDVLLRSSGASSSRTLSAWLLASISTVRRSTDYLDLDLATSRSVA